MAGMNFTSYEQFSDEALMRRYFELSEHPEDHAEELAAIDAAVHARLHAEYGAAEAAPRMRTAASL
jgi:hypothetical protein